MAKRIDSYLPVYQQHLREYLLKISPDTPLNELEELIQCFAIEKYAKNTILLPAGVNNNTVYFMGKGLVRIFYEKDGKEITNWLLEENSMFAPTYSILSGDTNYFTYQLLENSHLLKIDYAVWESYYSKYHAIERLGRRLISAYYGAFMRKTVDVLFLSAEERYQLFIKEHQSLLNRVPLRHIASYLGITQETLSRIRAKY